MALPKRTGPPTRNRRTPRRSASCRAARFRNTASTYNPQDRDAAGAIVREMKAAGAVFLMAKSPELGWFYSYRVQAGCDLARCRRIAADAKARPIYPLVRVQISAEIVRQRFGLPEDP